MSTTFLIYWATRSKASLVHTHAAHPEALEDAVNRLTEPRGSVIQFKRKAS